MRPWPSVLFLAFALPAAAAGSSPTGVWRGTLGKQEISACFAEHGEGSNYYYHRHGISIPLVPQGEPPAAWLECADAAGCVKSTGRWQVAPAAGDRLEGSWSDPQGKQRLDIRLTRVAPAGDDAGPCEGDAFNAPRIDNAKLRAEQTTFAGRSYRRLHFTRPAPERPEIATIELPGGDAHVARLNQALRKELREHIAGYYRCRGSGSGEYSAEVVPLFWNDRFVSLSSQVGVDCGGAHPSYSATRTTWDLTTGAEVNPWSWIKGSRKKDADARNDRWYFNYAAPEKLNALILKRAELEKMPEECRGVVQENSEYQISPAAGGLTFSTVFPHVVQACDIFVELPYDSLEPFLNAQGRSAVAALTAAASQPPGSGR